jgi:hypothetical protein
MATHATSREPQIIPLSAHRNTHPPRHHPATATPPWHTTATSREPHTSPKSSRFPPIETLNRHVTAQPRLPPPWHTTATSREPHTSPKPSRLSAIETLIRHVTPSHGHPTVAQHTPIHTLLRGASLLSRCSCVSGVLSAEPPCSAEGCCAPQGTATRCKGPQCPPAASRGQLVSEPAVSRRRIDDQQGKSHKALYITRI